MRTLSFPWFLAWMMAVGLRGGAIAAPAEERWFDFSPPPADFAAPSAIDLRSLNEPVAGAAGRVQSRDGHFLLGSGQPVRFWAVNGPSAAARTGEQLRREARLLARYGVNLVRVHGGLYDEQGVFDAEAVTHRIAVVEAMKQEGIYVHFSIYFPLWLKPRPDHPWLRGYNGGQHPFAALMIDPEFERQYQEWWRALLLTPSPTTGARLVDDAAVFGVEIQNEDSFFFWTFNDDNLPEPYRGRLQEKFAGWLQAKYGSPAAAVQAWGGERLAGDDPAKMRLAFRPLYAVFAERTLRDRDTAAFLFETQRGFYERQRDFLRSLGFQGLITCSNWATASPEVLGPLEKLSYTVGDFIDRHGYHSVHAQGENATWSIRDGHTYSDRSGYRFDRGDGKAGKLFVHPAMDPKYAGLPSMISETTWERPNRFRSEAPLYYAAFGALQDTDAIVHFAFDGAGWSVKPTYWMQPWTLMSPAMMGQFPAAASIYRRGLVQAGPVLATIDLSRDDLVALKGTPLPQDAALDELRLKDVREGADRAGSTGRVDPLVHYAGQARVNFVDGPSASRVEDLSRYIDHEARRVTAATGELALDYGRGWLRIDAPHAQGVSGLVDGVGAVALRDVTIEPDMELGHIVLVSLDDAPLARSRRMLLQVMSEERASGFAAEAATDGRRTIRSIGTDPWQVRKLGGRVTFRGAGAEAIRVTPLDFNGEADATVRRSSGPVIQLGAHTIYYLVERP